MKKNLALFTVAIGLALNCQLATAQSVTYKVTEDDPTPKALGVSLEPFFVECGANSTYIGWEARGNLDFKKMLSFQASYRTAYSATSLKHSTYGLMVPTSGQINPNYMEGTAMFNFSNKKKERYLKVVLWSSSHTSGGYTYTSSKFIMVPGHTRKIWSLRGSIYRFANNFVFEENEKKNGGNNFMYGISTKDNKDTVHWGSYGSDKNGSSIYNAYSVISGMVFAFGINSRTITNLWIDADGYGRKGNRGQTEWYIDYQISPYINLRNVVAKDGTEFDVKTNNGVKKYMGWRAGMVMRGVKKPFMSMKCEMGQRPGIKADLFGNFYINCSFGLYLPFKIKPMQYED